MTPETQREAVAVLAELFALSPDVRMGQLFAHLGYLGESHIGKDLANIDNDELMAVMYRHRLELLARTQTPNYPMPQPTGTDTSVSGSSTLPEMIRATGPA